MTGDDHKGQAPHEPPPAREDFLTARQLSAVLQVSESTVRRMAREGRIPFLQLTTRITRYNLPAVREALQGTPRGKRPTRRRAATAERDDQQPPLFNEA